MMAHELLRQAALILAQGWSKGSDARDDTGRIVPLYKGDARSTINPEAVASFEARSARVSHSTRGSADRLSAAALQIAPYGENATAAGLILARSFPM